MLRTAVAAESSGISRRTTIGDLVINVISPDGKLKPVKPGIGDKDIPNYWLPRHHFVKILLRQVTSTMTMMMMAMMMVVMVTI